MKYSVVVLGLGLVAIGVETGANPHELDRNVLPIHPPEVPLYTELNARNATPPPAFEVTAPEGAPNVLLILIDDMGFGVSSTFGGPAQMSTPPSTGWANAGPSGGMTVPPTKAGDTRRTPATPTGGRGWTPKPETGPRGKPDRTVFPGPSRNHPTSAMILTGFRPTA